MHPKTLSRCWIIATCTSKRNADILYLYMVEAVMKSGHPRAPLNLKVLAFLSLSIQLRPLNILAMTGPVVPIQIPRIRFVCLMRKKG